MMVPMNFPGPPLHAHDRLQQHRRSLACRLLEAHGGAILTHFVGIYFVITAVIERDLDVHQFVTGQDAASIACFTPCSIG